MPPSSLYSIDTVSPTGHVDFHNEEVIRFSPDHKAVHFDMYTHSYLKGHSAFQYFTARKER